MSVSPFHVWAIIRSLPGMQQVVVNRFRRRSDAEGCLRVLRQKSPSEDYILLYYPPEESTLMIRNEYEKLIRDRIPAILESQSVQFAVEEMPQAEYLEALRHKLIEEATEAAEAVESNLVIELADLWEVIDAIMNAYGIQRNQVLACQMERRIAWGSFSRKLRLLWTEVR